MPFNNSMSRSYCGQWEGRLHRGAADGTTQMGQGERAAPVSGATLCGLAT